MNIFLHLRFIFPCRLILLISLQFHAIVPLVKFSSVAQSCPNLCNPMDCSTPGFLVLHQLPELAQTHVNRVGDAIESSNPLSSPSPLAFISNFTFYTFYSFPNVLTDYNLMNGKKNFTFLCIYSHLTNLH